MKERKIAENVGRFLDRAAALYGKAKEETFSQDMWSHCCELGMESPIEHLFWIACHAMCESQHIPVNPCPIILEDDRLAPDYGLYLGPQKPIGKYRVDFLLTVHGGIARGKFEAGVVVELDGHAFHDKDARQRSYEKARDRFLISQGYAVLHFTGSDVCADPFKCAFESLSAVSPSIMLHDEYDPKDPFQRGW